MDLFNILSQIEQVDLDVYERLDSRRAVFKNMAGLGQKLSAAALPLAVGATFNKAYAQTPAGLAVTDVLNFALKLEYLESIFYSQRPTTGLTAPQSTSLALIAADEANHVSFLRTTSRRWAACPSPRPAPPSSTSPPVKALIPVHLPATERILASIWPWPKLLKIPAYGPTKAQPRSPA